MTLKGASEANAGHPPACAKSEFLPWAMIHCGRCHADTLARQEMSLTKQSLHASDNVFFLLEGRQAGGTPVATH